MNHIEQLINDAQTLIKDKRESKIQNYALFIEDFLARYEIPVNPYYDKKDFFRFESFPITNFGHLLTDFNSNEAPKINSELRMQIFIKNFIYNIYHDNYEILTMTNIFYPHVNNLFKFKTYKAPGRLNKDIMLTYVHPKYIYEEILHKISVLENYKDIDKLIEQGKFLLEEWDRVENTKVGETLTVKELGTGFNFINMFAKGIFHKQNELQISIDYNFGQNQIAVLKQLFSLDIKLIRCFYDPKLPILICNSADIPRIKEAIFSITPNSKVIFNDPKSFYDNRLKNVIFKIDDKPVLKLFPILNYEIIPIKKSSLSLISDAKLRASTFNIRKLVIDCNINIAIRLAFNEYITYEIVGADIIAEEKLKLYKNLIDTHGLKNYSLDNYEGYYYPYLHYLKELRVISILKNKMKNKK